jgi:hypothetical protein
MDTAVGTLARALAFQQPISSPQPYGAQPYGPRPYAPPAFRTANYPPPAPAPPNPNRVIHDHGVKLGITQPRSSGKSFSPGILVEFDARYGPHDYFVEFGAGLVIPTDDNYTTSGSTIRVTSGFLEFGGSYYLWAGNTATYVGAGLTPAFWILETGDSSRSYQTNSHTSATCGAHGQVGITFMRDARLKLFAEFRLTQLLLAVAHPLASSSSSESLSEPYRPMYLAFQGGVVW